VEGEEEEEEEKEDMNGVKYEKRINRLIASIRLWSWFLFLTNQWAYCGLIELSRDVFNVPLIPLNDG